MFNISLSVENLLNNQLFSRQRRWLEKLPISWLSLLVVAGVLLLSVVIPQRAPARFLLIIIGLPPAIGGLLAIIRWPGLGIMILIVAALIAPSPRLPGGFNTAVLFLMLLIGLWLLDMIARRRQIRLVASRTVRPLLALIIVAMVAFFVGQVHWFNFANPAPIDAQLGGLAIFILAAGAFFLVAHQVRDIRWLQGMTWVLIALGALFVAGWLVSPIGRITGRIFQLGATANSMFWTWLVALAFAQAFLNKKLHPGWRAILLGVVLATLYVAFFINRGWKSGYLPPMASIATIVAFRSKRAALLMALVAPFIVIYLSQDAIASDQYSYGTRVDAWIIVLDMIKINPILGFGPANYYWYTRLFPIRGYTVVFNSHNQYIDILAQTGILGLACVLWFFAEIGWLNWRLRWRVPEGFPIAYVYGALGGLVGTIASGMLVDWFLPFVYNIGLKGFRGGMLPWLFLGGLVSINKIFNSSENLTLQPNE